MSVFLNEVFSFLSVFPDAFCHTICVAFQYHYQLVSRAVFDRNSSGEEGAALVRRWVECDLRKKREGLDICALKERRPSARLCTQCGRCQVHGRAFGYWNSASWGCFRGSGWWAGNTLRVLAPAGYFVLSVYLCIYFSVWITEHRPLVWPCEHKMSKNGSIP